MNQNSHRGRPRKQGSEHVIRRNISLTPEMDRLADLVVRKYLFGGLSDYIHARLRQDAGIELSHDQQQPTERFLGQTH
jgi:hypothetical protein